jgi:hypothetical protein
MQFLKGKKWWVQFYYFFKSILKFEFKKQIFFKKINIDLNNTWPAGNLYS